MHLCNYELQNRTISVYNLTVSFLAIKFGLVSIFLFCFTANEQLITALREQVFKLKSELQVRDNELNRLHHEKESGVDQMSESDDPEGKNDLLLTPKASTSKTLQANDTQSESEAWSEPDRIVSR